MSRNLFDQVADFVAHETGVRRERIAPETLVEDDLGCTGDDALDLITDFSREFRVDLEDFRFDFHFGPERAAGPEMLILAPVALLAQPLRLPLADAEQPGTGERRSSGRSCGTGSLVPPGC